MEFSKEFKDALSGFTSKEKDKLIYRLLRKDRILSHRLYFELIDPETVDDKRLKMEYLVVEEIKSAASRYGKTKYFLTRIRAVSAKITEHVKITSDKFGEVSLQLLLISETLKRMPVSGDFYKLHIYLINKLLRAMILTQKLDPDYFLDLRQSYEAVHREISTHKNFERLALHNGLFLSWLNPENIPERLDLIVKGLKEDGLLR